MSSFIVSVICVTSFISFVVVDAVLVGTVVEVDSSICVSVDSVAVLVFLVVVDVAA